MKSKSARNPGRMLWRCHTWDANDDAIEKGVIIEERQFLEHEREEMKRKIVKLQMKLNGKRGK
ncbi:hypothetical protein SESBI_38760 [Sesbania bispinosa]|nr:hypothetical protein SESBI_38760 [Sesbania bispinosa]